MLQSKLLTITGHGYQLKIMGTKLASEQPAEQSVLAEAGFQADFPLILVCLLQPGPIIATYDPFAWTGGPQQEMMRKIHFYVCEHFEMLKSGETLTYHQL
jgi:hypothetical protein